MIDDAFKELKKLRKQYKKQKSEPPFEEDFSVEFKEMLGIWFFHIVCPKDYKYYVGGGARNPEKAMREAMKALKKDLDKKV